jgi:hypothetical protein
VIGHRKRTLWRSSRRFDTGSHDLGIVASSRAAVAYSVFRGRRQSLFIARLGEAERKVGVGEVALGFVGPRALVAERAGTLVLRRGRDWMPQRVADHAGNVVFDHAEHALYFVAHGWLERFDGGRVRRLARLAALGVGRRPQIEPLGKLVGLHSGRRLVVLHDDGSAFASTALPRPRARVDTVSSALAADAQGTAVAFTVSSGNSGYASRGSELVYLLRPGSTAARAVFRERLTFAVCERAASLAWRGPWLLYSSTEERVAVIDTRQPSRSIDLSRKVARLPGMGGDNGRFDAAWG